MEQNETQTAPRQLLTGDAEKELHALRTAITNNDVTTVLQMATDLDKHGNDGYAILEALPEAERLRQGKHQVGFCCLFAKVRDNTASSATVLAQIVKAVFALGFRCAQQYPDIAKNNNTTTENDNV